MQMEAGSTSDLGGAGFSALLNQASGIGDAKHRELIGDEGLEKV